MDAPSKHQKSSPPPSRPPLRRSSRISEQRTNATSTGIESPSAWSELAKIVKERVVRYRVKQFPHDDELPDAMIAFIDWLPPGGRESIARDIMNSKSDKELYDVYWYLFTGLAVPMKTRPEPPIRHDRTVADFLDEPEPWDAKFRNLILKRDGHCCIFGGDMDREYWRQIGSPPEQSFAPLEVAHIIPFAYESWSPSKKPQSSAAEPWGVLFRCFPTIHRLGMKASHINKPGNGITLRSTLHDEFEKFHMAFKPTDKENLYEIRLFSLFTTMEKRLLGDKRFVRFVQAEDSESMALPSRELLDCHWRMAEILNASGMAKVIDDNLRDWQDMKSSMNGSLEEDGTTDVEQIMRIAFWPSTVH